MCLQWLMHTSTGRSEADLEHSEGARGEEMLYWGGDILWKVLETFCASIDQVCDIYSGEKPYKTFFTILSVVRKGSRGNFEFSTACYYSSLLFPHSWHYGDWATISKLGACPYACPFNGGRRRGGLQPPPRSALDSTPWVISTNRNA